MSQPAALDGDGAAIRPVHGGAVTVLAVLRARDLGEFHRLGLPAGVLTRTLRSDSIIVNDQANIPVME
jgi:hypothetical protein